MSSRTTRPAEELRGANRETIRGGVVGAAKVRVSKRSYGHWEANMEFVFEIGTEHD